MKQRHPVPEPGGGFIIRWDCGFRLNCMLFKKEKQRFYAAHSFNRSIQYCLFRKLFLNFRT